MSIGNLKDNGNKGNNFPYQLSVLKLLEQINASIGTIPGVDYETRTTTYRAIAAGSGYTINDILVRYDIIDVNTGLVTTTVWFNQTQQTVIPTPVPANIVPINDATSVTVINTSANPVPVTLPAGTSRVPSVVLVPANTALTNTVAGKKMVSMRVSGGNGQIGGVAIPNGTTLTYNATSENDTVGSISYQTGVGTTILITYLT
jgi:hypothetical protein